MTLPLLNAADFAAQVLDLWLTGDEDFTEANVREAIRGVRAAIEAVSRTESVAQVQADLVGWIRDRAYTHEDAALSDEASLIQHRVEEGLLAHENAIRVEYEAKP